MSKVEKQQGEGKGDERIEGGNVNGESQKQSSKCENACKNECIMCIQG